MKKSMEDKFSPGRLSLAKNDRQKVDVPLIKLQKALRAAQVEAKRERRARRQAEKALAEAQEELAAIRREVRNDFQSQIKRISFVVRLTLDRQGQFGRTEIEHVSSSKKQNFLNLDGEHLVNFMKACINTTNTPGDTTTSTE
jgi:hypothetical protein